MKTSRTTCLSDINRSSNEYASIQDTLPNVAYKRVNLTNSLSDSIRPNETKPNVLKISINGQQQSQLKNDRNKLRSNLNNFGSSLKLKVSTD
jgi:lipid A disaccharide synthetase